MNKIKKHLILGAILICSLSSCILPEVVGPGVTPRYYYYSPPRYPYPQYYAAPYYNYPHYDSPYHQHNPYNHNQNNHNNHYYGPRRK